MKNEDYDLIINFSTQMYLITGTGQTIHNALAMIMDASTDATQKKIVAKIREDLKTMTLSQALSKSGRFDGYYINCIEIGIISGNFSAIFKYLSEYYQTEKANRNLISNTLSYPLAVTAGLVAVLVILATRILPIFNSIYESVGSQLSGIGKLTLEFGYFINDYFIYLLVIVTIIFLIVVLLMKIGKLDFFGPIRSLQKNAQDLYALSNLIQAGIIIDEAVLIAFGTNVPLEEIMAHRLTPLELQLLKVSGTTGNLEEVLDTLYHEYQRKSTQKLNQLVSRFELIFIGGFTMIVAIILLSIILPLFSILINL